MALRPGDFDLKRAAAAARKQEKAARKFESRNRYLLTIGHRWLLTIYLLAVVLICLFPPWSLVANTAKVRYSLPAEYRFIADPPRTQIYESASIDATRLLLTLVAMSAATGIVALWLPKTTGRKKPDD